MQERAARLEEAELRAFLAKAPELAPPIRPLDDLMLAWPQLAELMHESLAVPGDSIGLEPYYSLNELLHSHRKMTQLAAWFWQALQALPGTLADVNNVVNTVLQYRAQHRDALASMVLTNRFLHAHARSALQTNVPLKDQWGTLVTLLAIAWSEKQKMLARLQKLQAN
jgi:hypothetical protein